MEEYINEKIREYLDGNLPEEDEKKLREILMQTPEERLTDDMRAVRTMFIGFGALARERMPAKASRRRAIRITIPAAVVSLAASLAIGIIFSGSRTYGYDYDGKPIKDPDTALQQASCLQLLAGLEESIESADRISGILDELK